MRLNSLLAAFGVVAVGFCAGLLFLPAFWIELYGASVDAQATLLIRLIGALFGGLAVMAWGSRNDAASKSRDALVIGLAVLNGLAAIVAIMGAVSGVYNAFAWGPVATFLLFAFGFLVVRRSGGSGTAPGHSRP